jgi:segregation and condensation protein B
MRKQRPHENPAANAPTDQLGAETPRLATSGSPLSLSRLREAFAAMLGEGGQESRDDAASPHSREPVSPARGRVSPKLDRSSLEETALLDCEINPRSVVEAMLFVGRPDNGAYSSRELAAAMRGVSPAEIDSAVDELNARYSEDEAPYHIDGTPSAYRLVLRPEFERMRDKFYGRVREAKLSPTVLEVLSVLAYNQPATVEQINQLRRATSGAAMATLVRRRLARQDRPEDGGEPVYSTTDRFLSLFGLESLDALPRSEELEKI